MNPNDHDIRKPKNCERRVVEESHPDDQPITVFAQFLLPDVLAKLQEQQNATQKGK